jgi:uncharacterized membrane protein
MKNIKRLKTLLNVILILGIAGLVFTPFVLGLNEKIEIYNEVITEWTSLLICKVIVSVILWILFLVGIYKLRGAIEDFYQNQMFNDVLSKAFKEIGCLIIIGTLFHITLNWLAEIIFTDGISFHLNFDYLAHAGAALFFLTLSTMIDKAKGIQQENDLTI